MYYYVPTSFWSNAEFKFDKLTTNQFNQSGDDDLFLGGGSFGGLGRGRLPGLPGLSRFPGLLGVLERGGEGWEKERGGEEGRGRREEWRWGRVVRRLRHQSPRHHNEKRLTRPEALQWSLVRYLASRRFVHQHGRGERPE